MGPRIRLMIVTVIVSTSLAGCGENDPDPAGDFDAGGSIGGSTGDDTVEEPVDLTWTPDDAECTDASYPISLTVATDVEAERPYLRNVVACTGDEQYGPVWLHNVGDEAWTLDGVPDLDWLSYTEESEFYNAGFPDEPLLLPADEVVLNAAPGAVSWSLSLNHTIGWETQTEAMARLEAAGEAVAIARLRGSPKGAAVAACSFAAFNAAKTWTDDPDGFGENFGAALGSSAGAASCGAKWQTVIGRRFEPSARFLGEADESFRIFSAIGRILRVAIS